jgi:hypothetical protein
VSRHSASTAARPAPRRAAEAKAKATPKPDLAVVARRPRRRAGFLAAMGLFVVLGALLGLAAFQTRLAADQLQLDRLEAQVRDERQRFERLRGDEAALLAPERIVAEAERLGLVTPPDVQYVQPDPAVVAAVAARTPVPVHADGTEEPVETWAGVKPFVETEP